MRRNLNTSRGRFTPIKVNRLGLNSEVPIGKFRGRTIMNMICSLGGIPCRTTMEVLLTHLKNGSYELTKPAMAYFLEKTALLVQMESSGKLQKFNKLNNQFKDS